MMSPASSGRSERETPFSGSVTSIADPGGNGRASTPAERTRLKQVAAPVTSALIHGTRARATSSLTIRGGFACDTERSFADHAVGPFPEGQAFDLRASSLSQPAGARAKQSKVFT